MKVAKILMACATLLWANFAAAPVAEGQTYEGKVLVKASLVADTSAIVPGKPFTVGLLLRMTPGWHTYWKFAGDAGIPTEIRWKLPAGWKVGEIQWPIPLKLDEPGDIQIYGYHDEVLLMQEVTPPPSISESAVKLIADASWLVCEKICIPGSASLQLDLPKSTSGAPANESVFAKFRRNLPQSATDRAVSLEATRSNGSEVSLVVKDATVLKYPFVDFYPLPDEKTVVGHPKTDRHGEKVTFHVPLETAPPDQFRALLVAGQNPADQNRVGWLVSAQLPRTATAAPAQSRGLLTFLFFGFLGGFILNLMPCVLPVISLKIFGFIKQAGQDRQRILRSGLAFVAGIFAWFVGLALILIALKSAGHQITWALQFTNPYFVLGMSVFVLVFALNLFGVFEISLPQSATRGMLSTAERNDDVGSFFQGIFATILATPCTAPFLGTALGFAFTQSALVILSMFLAIAAGMSAPYLLLSAQPAWLRFLPRPGAWMVHVKQFMGFLLLATLLFLLYVLGAQRGLDGAIWASCFLLVVSVACWMKGAFVLPTASALKRAVVLILMLALVVASGVYFIGGKFRAATIDIAHGQIEGDWQFFTPARLQSELDQGRSVFVDFTAAWCLTCKFNEKSVIESASVREAFQRHGIVKIKADWTNGDPEITKLLQHFGRPGVPLYVLYPGMSAEPIVFPELLTKSMILDKLETINTTVASP
ncbi:MAG: protein-disulfide reductase DsbD domain-containing protein [Verrucomicrobiota bacterium]